MSLPSDEIFVRVGARLYHAASLAHASQMYTAARDVLGNGASGTPEGEIVNAKGHLVGRISYNGKVWPPGPWTPTTAPLLSPA
jgi:hypothetical protein